MSNITVKDFEAIVKNGSYVVEHEDGGTGTISMYDCAFHFARKKDADAIFLIHINNPCGHYEIGVEDILSIETEDDSIYISIDNGMPRLEVKPFQTAA